MRSYQGKAGAVPGNHHPNWHGGGWLTVAAVLLILYCLHTLIQGIRLWRVDVREHRLPRSIVYSMVLSTYTALPLVLLMKGDAGAIGRVFLGGAVLWVFYLLMRVLSFGASRAWRCTARSCTRWGARLFFDGEPGVGFACYLHCGWGVLLGAGSVRYGPQRHACSVRAIHAFRGAHRVGVARLHPVLDGTVTAALSS